MEEKIDVEEVEFDETLYQKNLTENSFESEYEAGEDDEDN